jgi:hypothetical protein
MRYQEESDSYLKKGMKDEAEKYPRPKGYNQIYRPKPPVKADRIKKTTDPNFYKPLPPVKGSTMPNKSVNKKKAALGSMLSSLSSGANFKN